MIAALLFWPVELCRGQPGQPCRVGELPSQFTDHIRRGLARFGLGRQQLSRDRTSGIERRWVRPFVAVV